MAGKHTRFNATSSPTSRLRLNATQRDLLNTRICDLSLALERSFVQQQILGLYDDLSRVGLHSFRPHVYLGDEWFSPEGSNAIAVPFYLMNRQLRTLEKKLMNEVEGGNALTCRQLLRHEAGHCFDHLYHVSQQSEWRKLFGDRTKKYQTARYPFNPNSTDYVQHLPDYYAQSHPDEDFAETFAVCITPNPSWRDDYKKTSKAYQKLLYVERLIKTAAKRPHFQPQQPTHDELICQALRKRMTIKRYYEIRKPSALLH